MQETEVANLTLGSLLRWVDPIIGALVMLGLIAIWVILAKGLGARRRGAGTIDAHWWLAAVARTLVLAGFIVCATRITAAYSEAIQSMQYLGLNKGFTDFIVTRACLALPNLFVPLGVALLATVVGMVLGAPREPVAT